MVHVIHKQKQDTIDLIKQQLDALEDRLHEAEMGLRGVALQLTEMANDLGISVEELNFDEVE